LRTDEGNISHYIPKLYRITGISTDTAATVFSLQGWRGQITLHLCHWLIKEIFQSHLWSRERRWTRHAGLPQLVNENRCEGGWRPCSCLAAANGLPVAGLPWSGASSSSRRASLRRVPALAWRWRMDSKRRESWQIESRRELTTRESWRWSLGTCGASTRCLDSSWQRTPSGESRRRRGEKARGGARLRGEQRRGLLRELGYGADKRKKTIRCSPCGGSPCNFTESSSKLVFRSFESRQAFVGFLAFEAGPPKRGVCLGASTARKLLGSPNKESCVLQVWFEIKGALSSNKKIIVLCNITLFRLINHLHIWTSGLCCRTTKIFTPERFHRDHVLAVDFDPTVKKKYWRAVPFCAGSTV
jgi:hypothetical protein